jgi:DNA repair protein RecO (recombination protein O)
VRLVLYEGRGELHTVTQAETLEWYPRLRSSGASLQAAGTACESVLRLFDEGGMNVGVYNLLCHELQLLDAEPSAAGAANLLSFRLKLLLAAGFVPALSACASCSTDLADVFFSPAAGGVVCPDCAGGDGFALDGAAHSFMASALGSPLKDAPPAAGATLAQVDRAVTSTLEYHAHVRLRSVA